MIICDCIGIRTNILVLYIKIFFFYLEIYFFLLILKEIATFPKGIMGPEHYVSW